MHRVGVTAMRRHHLLRPRQRLEKPVTASAECLTAVRVPWQLWWWQGGGSVVWGLPGTVQQRSRS